VLALCALLALNTALASGTAVATTSSERQAHAMVNQDRTSHGIFGLRLSSALSKQAHRHSSRMAESGRLFHSCLTCSRGRGTSASAENVGMGDTLKKIHAALMNSSSHRQNILSKQYRRVGVGVVRRSGRLWVTQLFA
jgi:uncharacterized protein YkwD